MITRDFWPGPSFVDPGDCKWFLFQRRTSPWHRLSHLRMATELVHQNRDAIDLPGLRDCFSSKIQKISLYISGLASLRPKKSLSFGKIFTAPPPASLEVLLKLLNAALDSMLFRGLWNIENIQNIQKPFNITPIKKQKKPNFQRPLLQNNQINNTPLTPLYVLLAFTCLFLLGDTK